MAEIGHGIRRTSRRAGTQSGVREREQRLGVFGLSALLVIQARVLEGDRCLPGKHLEQPKVVLVELIDPELRDDDCTDHATAVT